MELRDKRVLVTGAGGFIASHLTRRLVDAGAEVFVLCKYNSVVDNVRLCDLWDRVGVVEADLRNVDSLRRVAELRPQVIFHAAAYNHVGDSFRHVSESLGSNAHGTANLLESYAGYERFVYVSSSEVYGYQTEMPFAEGSEPRPISPYAIGKYAGELYCRMKHHSAELPIVCVRPFNTFGPYQSPRAVIAEMVIQCLSGATVRSTEGRQTREFNFVANIVDGLVLAAEKDAAVGQIINVGTGEEIAIRDLIRKIHALTGSRSRLDIGALENRPTEIWRMGAAHERAEEILGWRPRIGFEEGLKITIDWYRRFLEVYRDPQSALWRLSSAAWSSARRGGGRA